MNQFQRALWIGIFGLLVTTGCASHKKPILPAHDEVLVYNLSFDLTYLRTLDALQSVPGWDLESTSKDAGLIAVRNINYSALDDADKRVVNFIIKRLDSRQTSVELDKNSQQTIGAGDLIKAVGSELAREVQK